MNYGVVECVEHSEWRIEDGLYVFFGECLEYVIVTVTNVIKIR